MEGEGAQCPCSLGCLVSIGETSTPFCHGRPIPKDGEMAYGSKLRRFLVSLVARPAFLTLERAGVFLPDGSRIFLLFKNFLKFGRKSPTINAGGDNPFIAQANGKRLIQGFPVARMPLKAADKRICRMIIDPIAETAIEQFPADPKLDLRTLSERSSSSSNSPDHSSIRIALEMAGQEKPSIYPRELTQIPAYVDHLPVKRIKSAFSSLVTESLNLIMEKSPRAQGLRSENLKIIDAGFGTMASEFFSKAA
jgi:hypothetical protein